MGGRDSYDRSEKGKWKTEGGTLNVMNWNGRGKHEGEVIKKKDIRGMKPHFRKGGTKGLRGGTYIW